MNAPSPDVHQILEYRADQAIASLMPWALVLCLMGLVMLIYPDRGMVSDAIAGWVLLLAGVGGTAFALHRGAVPGKPQLVLSPQGLSLRIGSVKQVLIPWHEIQAVDTIDFKVWNWASRLPLRVRFRDCTAVLVSKAFYDTHMHVASAFMRGPTWESLFRPHGEQMHVALHHEQFSVQSGDLRDAIEQRWRAFRDRPVPAPHQNVARRISVPARAAIITSPWSVVKIAVPILGILVVLANAMGVWQTRGQQEARIAQAERAKEERRAQEQRKQEQEERKRQQEKWDKFYRDMRRL